MFLCSNRTNVFKSDGNILMLWAYGNGKQQLQRPRFHMGMTYESLIILYFIKLIINYIIQRQLNTGDLLFPSLKQTFVEIKLLFKY